MKTHIAIADDHPLLLHALADLLSKYFTVDVIASGGNELMEKIKQGNDQPHVAVVDVSMQGMDGYDTARMLKSNYPQTKIIAFSMSGRKSVEERMFDCGADAYVLKPGIEQLITTIQQLAGENCFSG